MLAQSLSTAIPEFQESETLAVPGGPEVVASRKNRRVHRRPPNTTGTRAPGVAPNCRPRARHPRPAVAGTSASDSPLLMIMLPDPKHDGALTGQLDRIMQLIIPCPDRGLTETSGVEQ